MQSGRLRNQVTFQKQIKRKDELGQQVNEWVDVCTVRAEIRDVSGKEYQSSQSEQMQTDCKILIRYRNDITSDMRVMCNGTHYDIKAVLEDVKRTRLELPCQKGVRYD
ncbi:phage head closure protein [Gilliamella sp. B3486]|uniref:phage head closure protein n=1 Tax=unclassified Gilliamella TaxID=2685620 RepID=UPI00226A3076|nr:MULTISPECIES: phage head closure protein [unclassified Gilliamella]MCX8596804.1 phage head closure protein [Gilliamella sp. B3493]MCX8598533.1 phage head closure protein [Gilliamella sp. B3486]MCX8704520.1 phage head closure protein [Gilliamella sp. B3127]